MTSPSGFVRPFTELGADLVNDNVARYNFITPNVINDMHDWAPPLYNPVRQGDDWLAQTVPAILRSSAYRDNGVLIITWDEGSYAATEGPIGMIVLSPQSKGRRLPQRRALFARLHATDLAEDFRRRPAARRRGHDGGT